MPQLSSVTISSGSGLQSFAAPSGNGATSVPVTSVFGRTGAVVLTSTDVLGTLGYIPAGLLSPHFSGTPTAPTPPITDNSPSIATTAFVKELLAGYTTNTGVIILALGTGLTLTTGTLSAAVTSVFERTGAITLTQADVTAALGYSPVAAVSPTFTGVPTAPTAASGDASNTLATTAFVQAAIPVGLSVTSTGAGLNLISGTLSAAVVSVFGRVGAVTLLGSDVTTALGYAPVQAASPRFTGTPLAPDVGMTTSSQIATVTYVQNVIGTASSLNVKNNISYFGVLIAPVATVVAAGSSIYDATQIDNQVTVVVSALPGTGIGFQAPLLNVEYKIINRSGAQVLVYPPSTGIYARVQWENQGVGTPVAVAGEAMFILVNLPGGIQGYVY